MHEEEEETLKNIKRLSNRPRKEMRMRKKIRTAMLLAAGVCLLSAPFAAAQSDDAPDEVVIDQLASLYEPVVLDHASHVGMVDNDCSVCHHHTTGKPTTNGKCLRCHANSGPAAEVACYECHPANRFSADYLRFLESNAELYHKDKPGLKGAYHRLCMDCHRDNDGPTGCQDCHARTDAGDKEFHAGSYSPPPSAPKRGHEGE